MEALLTSPTRLRKWFSNTANLLIKRGKKNIHKLKGKPPKPSAWQIIDSLA